MHILKQASVPPPHSQLLIIGAWEEDEKITHQSQVECLHSSVSSLGVMGYNPNGKKEDATG